MFDTPQIHRAGLTGIVIRFADALSEPANRAALAFRAALEGERKAGAWPGVEETASTLASVFLKIDPLVDAPDRDESLRALINTRDWTAADLPGGRRLWRIPCAWGGRHGPNLSALAAATGLSEAAAISDLAASRPRVLALGFAPGQPYLGPLAAHWDLPRLEQLNPQIPAGSVALAIRQLVLFANASPTGWSHVGQTAFSVFQPESETPIPLLPADELELFAVSADEMDELLASGDPLGGATREEIS